MEISEAETTIKVIVHTNDVSLSEQFSEDLYCCRDVELEEYGWELSNDISYACSLDTLGMLIDTFEISEDNEQCTIILHRLKR